MDTKLVVIAIAAVVVVAAVGGYMLLNDDEEYDLIIAKGTAFTHEPTWIADHFGLFEEEGLKVKFVTVDGGGTGMSALLAGRVDMTVSGADPVVRMMQNSDDAKVVGMIEYAGVSGQMSFATLDNSVDLSDPLTLLNAAGDGVRIHCGMDINTAYYSNYLLYLKKALDESKISTAQYDLLRGLRTGSSDGGIVSLEHGNIASALLSGEVEMILAADQITVAKEAGAAANPVIPVYDKYAAMPATAVFLSVSGKVLEEKSDAVLKAVRAYGKACDLLNSERKSEMIEYCSEYGGMAIPNLTYAIGMFKWKLCQLENVESYLSDVAFALGEEGFDTTNRVTYEYLLEIYPDGMFVYNPNTNTYGAYAP